MVRLLRCHFVRHAPASYPSGTLPPVDADATLPNQAIINAMAAMLPKNATWWVSPLKRCQQTANALLEAGAVAEFQIDEPLLCEQRFGRWHGQDVSAVWRELEAGKQPKHNWNFLHSSVRPPEGESFEDVISRQSVLQEKLSTVVTKDLVIVAHAGVIRAWLALALGLDAEQALCFDVAPFSLSQMSFMREGASAQGGAWQLQRLNQTMCF